jgi:DNA replication ATP-dependent helicase Dna2
MNIITNQKTPNTIESNSEQIMFHDRRITEVQSQALAVKRALKSCSGEGFFLIHGPPGTGKTTVITEIVRQLVGKDQKVLITSHTNVAVDNVLENLFPYLASRMVRLGTKIKVTNSLKALVPKTQDELIKLKLSQVVGATLSKLSVLVLNQKLSFDEPYFDAVIIDESSMATIPLTLCGVLLAKSFILVGDHKQLPPIAKTTMPPACSSAQNCGKICESLFKLLITICPDSSTMLELQFRSHPAIMGFSSKQFYYDRIQSAKSCHEKKLDLPKSSLLRCHEL